MKNVNINGIEYAPATSNISERIKDALTNATNALSPERISKLEEIRRRATELSQKGIIRNQSYSTCSSADLQKRYLSSGEK